MSMVTLRVNDILKNLALPNKNLRFDILIDSTKDKFFDFDFPWYSADNKGLEEFKTLFLQKYMMYEIGFETFELFKLYLCNHLSLNMERWKMLYDVISRDFDVLSNYKNSENYSENKRLDRNNTIDDTYSESRNINRNNKTDYSGNTSNSGTTKTDSTRNTQSIASDNPQVNFSGVDYASSMNRGEDVTTENSTSNNNSEYSDNTTDVLSGTDSVSSRKNVADTQTDDENRNYKKSFTGYSSVTPASMIDEWSKAIINLNKEIIDSCENLFIGVW